MAHVREQMVTTSGFLRSVKKLGVKMLEGVCEIVDNSLDAGASEIKIHIESKSDGSLRIIFKDNGIGIPFIHVNETGIHQGIPYVLTYGGRIRHKHKSFTLKEVGKFGWGLSQTASCLSSRTEVYSKNENDKRWRYSYYDFKELVKDPDILLPEEVEADPPYFELPETGTIVVLESVDNSEYKKPSAIHSLLVKNLGKIYRHFLTHGREIIVSSRENDRPKETIVAISDPIMQIEESKEVQLAGKSILEHEDIIEFNKNHPLGPIYEDEGYAILVAKFVRLDSESIRKSLNLPLSGASQKITKELKSKFGISAENAGFSLIRNGREIGSGQTLGLFTRSNPHNYIRIELFFSDKLDDLFKIRTNKSRYDVTEKLSEILEKRYSSIISSLVTKIANIMKSLSLKKNENEIPIAEIIVAKAAPNMLKKQISIDERKALEEEIRKEVQDKIDKIKHDSQERISQVSSELAEAEVQGNNQLISKYKDEIQIINEKIDYSINRIDERFSINSLIRKEFGKIGTGELFSVQSRGDQAWIKINTGTEFYANVYSRIEKNPELLTLLDLMIFSMGYAEHMQDTSASKKSQWEDVRREVSALASQMVSSMAVNSLTVNLEGGEN